MSQLVRAIFYFFLPFEEFKCREMCFQVNICLSSTDNQWPR